MTDEVLLNKAASIERCLKRIQEEYVGHEKEFLKNYTKQDAIMLNLQRACETAIDAAMHMVQIHHLGLPQSSREVFELLEKANYIPPALSRNLQAMVGLRNIALHEYTRLDINVVVSVLEKHLQYLSNFSELLIKFSQK